MTADARLLSPKSPEADLLAAANLAQAVGAEDLAAPLVEAAKAKRLERRRARNLADAYAATNYSFDEAM